MGEDRIKSKIPTRIVSIHIEIIVNACWIEFSGTILWSMTIGRVASSGTHNFFISLDMD